MIGERVDNEYFEKESRECDKALEQKERFQAQFGYPMEVKVGQVKAQFMQRLEDALNEALKLGEIDFDQADHIHFASDIDYQIAWVEAWEAGKEQAGEQAKENSENGKET